MQRSTLKLVIRREMIRRLDNMELRVVVGGGDSGNAGTGCPNVRQLVDSAGGATGCPAVQR